jgi:RNA polymerase sigma factor (sigma-70 family)
MASQRQHSQQRTERNAKLLDRLLRHHHAALLNQARFHSEQPADADDALSDACVLFLRRFEGEEEDHALRYLLVVVKRCAWAISRRRRKLRRRAEMVSLDQLEADLGAGIVDDARGPEQQVEAREEMAPFVAAVNALTADQRTALILFSLGFSYSEIAERCGWTWTKVNRSLAEGRIRLGQLLGEGGESS